MGSSCTRTFSIGLPRRLSKNLAMESCGGSVPGVHCNFAHLYDRSVGRLSDLPQLSSAASVSRWTHQLLRPKDVFSRRGAGLIDGERQESYAVCKASTIKDSGCGAAWLARLLGVQEVPGSNPGSPTKFPKDLQSADSHERAFWSPFGVQTLRFPLGVPGRLAYLGSAND